MLGQWGILFVTIMAVVCSLLGPTYAAQSACPSFRAGKKIYPVNRTTDSLCNIVAPLPQFDCAPCLLFVHTVYVSLLIPSPDSMECAVTPY
ncbi:hypothetical protein OUZ56_010592 [Daphnia magna]|uniref:Secreted protein n=1 Tax=Daphnia magna TaxID=35525 RepID=A0ABR0AJ20_9CRUS|nr:hypothetical protein OUZ56_010592 [Daphnia magna]